VYKVSKNLTYSYKQTYTTYYNNSIVDYKYETGTTKVYADHTYAIKHDYFIPDSYPTGIYTH